VQAGAEPELELGLCLTRSRFSRGSRPPLLPEGQLFSFQIGTCDFPASYAGFDVRVVSSEQKILHSETVLGRKSVCQGA